MTGSDPPTEGDVYRHERTFTRGDVERFGDLSGDRQAIHTEPDEDGRLVVQGLLTATLPTAIGADLGVLARRMEFAFHQPVYTDEPVACEVTVESTEDRGGTVDVTASVACRNAEDTVVVSGEFEGLIRA